MSLRYRPFEASSTWRTFNRFISGCSGTSFPGSNVQSYPPRASAGDALVAGALPIRDGRQARTPSRVQGVLRRRGAAAGSGPRIDGGRRGALQPLRPNRDHDMVGLRGGGALGARTGHAGGCDLAAGASGGKSFAIKKRGDKWWISPSSLPCWRWMG